MIWRPCRRRPWRPCNGTGICCASLALDSNGVAWVAYRFYNGINYQTAVQHSTAADYSNNMRTITVTIYWTNYPRGLTNTPIVRTRQMQTLVARYGMQNYVYK